MNRIFCKVFRLEGNESLYAAEVYGAVLVFQTGTIIELVGKQTVVFKVCDECLCMGVKAYQSFV